MFNKIVVGLDGSDHSETALRLACDLAGKYNSALHLVHAPQPDTVAFALGSVAGYHVTTPLPSAEEVKSAADKVIARAESIAAEYGVPVAAHSIEYGEPADQIVDYARKVGADLIVTGRRGLGAVGAFIQGSTSQRIGHLAECAVLSVI